MLVCLPSCRLVHYLDPEIPPKLLEVDNNVLEAYFHAFGIYESMLCVDWYAAA